MNIFILDRDLTKSAQLLCDQHLIKQILELAQVICTALSHQEPVPYKPTHKNHPVTIYTSKNIDVCCYYMWVLEQEYEHRFNKQHKSYLTIRHILDKYKANSQNTLEFKDFPIRNDLNLIKEKLQDWKTRTNKRKIIAKWTKRSVPDWYAFDNNKNIFT